MKREALAEDQRKAVFMAVVEAEDKGTRPGVARQQVAEQFSISVEDVVDIEEEGVDKTWPPLEA